VLVLLFVSRDWSGKLAARSQSPRPVVKRPDTSVIPVMVFQLQLELQLVIFFIFQLQLLLLLTYLTFFSYNYS